MTKMVYMCRIAFVALAISSFLLTSCEHRGNISPKEIIGKWTLESLESEINGVPDANGEIEGLEDVIYCEYFDDSTYVLNDGEIEERGTWILKDSLLGMLLDGVENDSINYTWYRVINLDDSTLVKRSDTNSDCGIITEISTYHRVGN